MLLCATVQERTWWGMLQGQQLQKWMHQMIHEKEQMEKYSEFEDSLILNKQLYRCLKRKVRERLPLIQLIVSESCLCFISANTPLLLQHTINYSTFSTGMWGGAREKWMTKVAEQGMKCGWSNFRAILLPSAQVECSIMHTSFSFSFLSSHP